MALGLILALGAAGFLFASSSAKFAGSAGGGAFNVSFDIIGIEALLFPILLIACGVAVLTKRMLISPRTGVGMFFILVAILSFLGIVSPASSPILGGTLGLWSG